ncbi:MAG TPA: hypothetical protein VI306_13345 [Pyrinomonadaceae bacterium]
MEAKRRITIERQVLLIEIERRCFYQECEARNFIGLTKKEAFEYHGFECSACERWNTDNLKQTDVPDWWDEINPGTTH